jgi:hypothetical protein
MLSTRTLDLEAQSSLATPVTAYTWKSSTKYRHNLTMNSSDPIDDFFGMTRESHHDRHPSSDALPVYIADDTALPRYSAVAPEPVTLAMYLFKFGFCVSQFFLHPEYRSLISLYSFPTFLDPWCLYPFITSA